MNNWVSDNGNSISFEVFFKEKGETKKEGLFWYKGSFFGLNKEAYQNVSFYSREVYPLKKLLKLDGFLYMDDKLVKGKVYSAYRFIPKKRD